MKIPIKIRLNHPNATIPTYAHPGDSGVDFCALDSILIAPGRTVLVDTGVSMKIPNGYELQIRPRSGLSLNTGLRVANSPGTVDSNFLGSICIIVQNTGMEDFLVKRGDRIAQGVFMPVAIANFIVVTEFEETSRNDKGFGSSGL